MQKGWVNTYFYRQISKLFSILFIYLLICLFETGFCLLQIWAGFFFKNVYYWNLLQVTQIFCNILIRANFRHVYHETEAIQTVESYLKIIWSPKSKILRGQFFLLYCLCVYLFDFCKKKKKKKKRKKENDLAGIFNFRLHENSKNFISFYRKTT